MDDYNLFADDSCPKYIILFPTFNYFIIFYFCGKQTMKNGSCVKHIYMFSGFSSTMFPGLPTFEKHG